MSTLIQLTSFHFNHEIHIDFDEIEFMLRVTPISSTIIVKPDEEKVHTILGMKTKSNFKVLETPEEIKAKAAQAILSNWPYNNSNNPDETAKQLLTEYPDAEPETQE